MRWMRCRCTWGRGRVWGMANVHAPERSVAFKCVDVTSNVRHATQPPAKVALTEARREVGTTLIEAQPLENQRCPRGIFGTDRSPDFSMRCTGEPSAQPVGGAHLRQSNLRLKGRRQRQGRFFGVGRRVGGVGKGEGCGILLPLP